MGAAFDSGERHPPPNCFRGTRKELIAKVSEWIDGPCDRRIGWLNGLAGSGKSAIVQTIAEDYALRKKLAASFFFSRGILKRSNTTHFFPTIAYQLTISIPSLKRPIFEVLQDDPTILTKSFRHQVQKLIINPLLTMEEPLSLSMAVVIDAIDECDDNDLVGEIISLLANAPRITEVPLRFLIACRPERHIRAKMADPIINSVTRSFDLSEFSAQDDIRLFLNIRFEDIYNRHYDVMRSISKPWPSHGSMESLVMKSSGLFVFASTMLEFIDDEGDNPNRRLETVLNIECRSGELMFAPLDQLYKEIIYASSYNDTTRSVVGTITLLFDPLPLDEVEVLIGLRRGDGWLAMRRLHSIFIVPDDQGKPVLIFHSSLHEFLTNAHRSGEYFVDSPKQHVNITHFCLELMTKTLKRDVGNMEDPLNLSLGDNRRRKQDAHISGALQYACRYWASHLLLGPSNSDLLNTLHKFGFTSILYWVEALSLIGALDSAQASLQRASEWLAVGAFPYHFLSVFHLGFLSLLLSRLYPTLLPHPRWISLGYLETLKH